MKYTAIIEIPKGSDRRIHMSYDNTGFIDLGPIKEQISINNGIMPVHYGYIENTINKIEKDNIDVIIFSTSSYKTGDKAEIEIIGMLNREDDDHKVIAADDTVLINSFEEILLEEKELILKYFGYKSKIISIDNKEAALKYIEENNIKN